MIYIITHKKYKTPNSKFYKPLYVGQLALLDLDCVTDRTGDNISLKNKLYCELTGLYWIWKNTTDEYVGLVHYRRYFINIKRLFCKGFDKIYTYGELVEKLDNADILLPQRICFPMTVKNQMIEEKSCSKRVLELLKKVIEEKYPDYLRSFFDIFSQNKLSCYNMMFCSRNVFDKYCFWLFDILFQLENYINETLPEEDQSRLYGFLSERLLNVWVKKQGLNVKYLPVVNIEDSTIIKLKKPLSCVKSQIKFVFERYFKR